MENTKKISVEAAERIANATSVDEVLEAFRSEGVDITEADLQQYAETVKSNGEISESDLENVAGGGLLTWAIGAAYSAVWAITPGKNNQQKAQFVCDWWYKKLTGKK